MRLIDLTLPTQKLPSFSFLKTKPTRVFKNGDFYKFIYYEPVGEALSTFSHEGIYLSLRNEKMDLEGWELVRDIQIALASPELLKVLENMEANTLSKNRQGFGLELKDWIFNLICNGIYTKNETATLVRLLFVNGYSFEQVVDLFTAITKRKELASYFIEVANRLYKEVEFEYHRQFKTNCENELDGK